MERAELVAALERIVGVANVLHRPADMLNYESDGTIAAHLPTFVVWPTSTQQVVEVVRLARQADVPIVPRGAGTGIAGGSIPTRGGLIVCTTRMNRTARARPSQSSGYRRAGLRQPRPLTAAKPHGCFFAPDPASQKVSTIGGNVATNAGGVHCLAWGATTNHVLGLEVVTPSGEVIQTGGLARRRARLRPDRPHHRLGGDARHRHQDDGAADAAAGGVAAADGRLRRPDRGQPGRLGDDRRRHRAGRAGDDRRADLPGGRVGLPTRLPPGRRRDAADRDRRPDRGAGRGRGTGRRALPSVRRAPGAGRRQRGRARRDVGGAQGARSAHGPTGAQLLRPGRRRAAHATAAHD